MRRVSVFAILCAVVLIGSTTANGRVQGVLPAPTGASPGPGWTNLASPSDFSSPTFSWVYGTATPDGCQYKGELSYQRGQPHNMIGVWSNSTTCTMEIMTGSATPAFTAHVSAVSQSKSITSTAPTTSAVTHTTGRHTLGVTHARTTRRASWDHTQVNEFWAIDAYHYLFGIHDELGWNGTWSSDCYASDYQLYDGIAWGEAQTSGGGTCFVGMPDFDAGNNYDINEASATWNSNIFNGDGDCSSQGATGRWWTKIYGRGSGVVIDWTFTPGGNCGSYLTPYLT